MAKRKKNTRAKSARKRASRKKTPSEETLVVAHLLDGSLLKGMTEDFYVENDTFTLTDREHNVEIVDVSNLKALFFVKNLDGNRDYRERKGFHTENNMGNKAMAELFDGEVLFGYTHASYSEEAAGFFIYPGDPASNNIKVFVVRSSAKRIKVVPNESFAPTRS